MQTKKKSLTICMPALNEATRISKTLTEVYGAAKELLDEFEIIVVDDGSTDGTSAVVKKLIDEFGSEIRLIRKEVNEGLGYAFKTVVENAKYDYITSIVSDNAFQIEGIRRIFSAVGLSPVILGFRENFSSRPMLRKIISSCVTGYVRLLSGKKIKDAQGLVLLKTNLCRKMPFVYARYNFQMQVVVSALCSVNQFYEVPIIYSIGSDLHSRMLNHRVLIDVIQSSVNLLFLKLKRKL